LGNELVAAGVIPQEESGSSPWAAVLVGRSRSEVTPVTEIVVLSLAIATLAVLLGGVVRRIGDLDDISAMRDMVDPKS
jgi:hypothetical protein